jgi:hypothetical protein
MHDSTEMRQRIRVTLEILKNTFTKLKNVAFIMVWGQSLTSKHMKILKPLSSTGPTANFKPQCNGSSTEKMQCSLSWTAAGM